MIHKQFQVDNGFSYKWLIGLKLEYVSASSIKILPGACVDSLNSTFFGTDSDITISITTSGLNGLDTGTEADSTWYYVYLVYNPTNGGVGGLFSDSLTSPTLPTDYTKFRLVGCVRNTPASNFLNFYQYERGNNRFFLYREERTTLEVLSNGNAAIWTDVDLSQFIPPNSNLAYIYFAETKGAKYYDVREDGSTLTTYYRIYASNGSLIDFPIAGQALEYKGQTNNIFATIAVMGFCLEI